MTRSRWGRFVDTIRAYTIAPLSAKSPELAKYWGQNPVSSGVSVTEFSALNYSAVWAAVSLISSQVASLPLILYKRTKGGGKERYTEHPLYRLLHDEPNREMTSLVFREVLQAHALTWGNAYAEIERDVSNRPIALWPLTPDRVEPFRAFGDLRYRIHQPGGAAIEMASNEILHIPGLGFDGTCGYSVIAKARESLGLGIAAERFGGSFYGNGSTFGGVLTHPKILNDKARTNLEKSLQARSQGVDRAHKFLMLEEGMTYERLGIPPNDAQFIETRKFQIEEVCRWFNVPPHKIRDLDRATFSNIESQAIEFVTDTLRPWLIRWEQEIKRKLISRSEQNIQFAEHLVDGLLRGDIASRYAAYAVGRNWGWLSADDVRERENLNPLPNGEGQIYLVPTNMTPASRINEVIDAQIAPKPAPVPSGPTREDLESELSETRDTAAQHMARAAALEAQLSVATGDATATRADLAQARESVTDALGKAAALSAVLLLKDEQIAREQAERSTAEAAALLHAEKSGAEAVRADAAERERDLRQSERDALAETSRLAAEALRLKDEQIAREREVLAAKDAEILSHLEMARFETERAETAEKARDQSLSEFFLLKAFASQESQDFEGRMSALKADSDGRLQEARNEVTAKATELDALRQQLEAERQRADMASAGAIQAASDAQALVTQKDAALAEAEDRLFALPELESRATAAEHRANEQDARIAVALADVTAATAALDTAKADRDAALAFAEASEQATVQTREMLESVEAEIATIREAEAARMTAVIAAHRELVVDALGRMTRREVAQARRHQATPEKLRSWLSGFDVLHREVCIEALLPAMRAHLAWKLSDAEPVEAVSELVTKHLAEWHRQINAALNADPDEFHSVLDKLLTRWENDRAGIVADGLMAEQIAYLRSVR